MIKLSKLTVLIIMKKYLPVILLLATVTLSACGTQKVDTGKSINKEEGQELFK